MNYLKASVRKVTSGLITASLVVGSVIATSTAAQAAAFPGDPVGPTSSTAVTKNPSGNQGTAFWYEWNNSTESGFLTVDTCVGSNLGSGPHAVSVYESANSLVNAPTTAMTPTSTANCGSSGKGKQVVVPIATSKFYYVKVDQPQNGTYNFSVKFSVTASAPAAPPSYIDLDRVTICHRTHATTNPYRMITVSTSSIVGSAADGSPIRGHAKHATDARRYNPSLYGVYDSTKTYRPNAKLWGDIIPPFRDAATGGEFPGLNWVWGTPTATDTILDKTEFGTSTVVGNNSTSNTVAQSAIDACKGASGNLTARQLFDLERKNGEKRQDILDEIAETDAFESDPANKEKTVLDSQLPAREGPKNIPANPIAQSLSGNVWLDINRNGFQEDNEPDMSNIRVTVQNGAPTAAASTFTGFGTGARVLSETFGANWLTGALDSALNSLAPAINYVRGLLGMVTTYTVYTDVNGFYIFKSLAAGEWYATGAVPAGLDVTYDSAGVADATADTVVPAGGHAFTWIGLMGDSSTGIKSTVKNPDGTLASKDVVLTYAGVDGKFCTDDDVNYVLTPTNGVIEMTGITAGNYYVRQIGTTGTIADFTITSGAVYTSEIKTTSGVRCPVLKDSELAATGGQVDNKAAGAIGLLLVGLFATFVGVRRSRATS